MSNFYTKHVPKIISVPSKASGKMIDIYEKVEINDDFYHIKTKSISIAAKILEAVDGVRINITHRDVVVKATKDQIRLGTVLTFKNETKYYLPIEKWTVESGDPQWTQKMKA